MRVHKTPYITCDKFMEAEAKLKDEKAEWVTTSFNEKKHHQVSVFYHILLYFYTFLF